MTVKQFVFAYKLGRPCMDCGNTFPPCAMDFDHRDPTKKVRNVAFCASYKAAAEEIAKCDLVCACCHRIRHEKRRMGGSSFEGGL